ncbi:hypothetical protein V6N13_013335 [Hibiscus sabdariffa]|uniref:Uncharacterized protein n=1 Tax=Hibiscus sabdariffa TaxID=183260 RepID=A0ABR2SII8_9ROSI
MGWDISLRAPLRRTATPSSLWLREDPFFGAEIVAPSSTGNRGTAANLEPSFTNALKIPTTVLPILMASKSNSSFSSSTGLVASLGPSANMDTSMAIADESKPLSPIEGSKRARVQSSPPEFSGSSDLKGDGSHLSAGLVQVRCSQ